MSQSEAIALPLGLEGQWSLFVPGDVPSTVQLPTGAITLHPKSVYGSPLPLGTATIAGTLAAPLSNVSVQFVSRGVHNFIGALTQADGSFRFSVPTDQNLNGLVVADTLGNYPQLALASVTVSPGATTTVDALALAAPNATDATGTASPLPALPTGLDYIACGLEVAMSDAEGPWRATVLMKSSPDIPRYQLPGYTLIDSYDAVSADGLRHAETSGPPGQVPDFLQPPDLSAVTPTFAPGTALAWPAVPGATLYTASVSPMYQNLPLWEGATTQTTLTLPAQLSIPAQGVWLQVDAWDATGVDIYSVASLRALRVPDGPQGPSGRHSWARLAGTWQP